ncbi:MAG: class I SAM-dependent methyltransferase [Myxococcales bacterium]|nr:class I SAM-dependent methyltransferase [Myxococcales bacterium]
MPVEEQYYTKARVAHKYDVYIGKNIPFYWPALHFIADHLAAHFRGRQGLVVLDLGCGTANHCITVSKKVSVGPLTLVDHSAAILEVAQRKVAEAETIPAPVAVRHGSFLEPATLADIEAESVDLILSSLTLDHIHEDEEFVALLRRLHGILKPGGCFVLCEKSSSPDPSTPSWRSFAEMIHIRGENNRRHDFKNEAEIAEWKQHNFEEDVMRPLSLSWTLAEQAGFQVETAGGAVLPPAEELDYERFYEIDFITPLDRARVFDTIESYGAGILICSKR